MAEEEPREEPPPPELPTRGLAVGLGADFYRPSLANDYFDGHGIPRTGGPTQPFHFRGRDFGLLRPTLAVLDTRVDYMNRYAELGFHFIYGGSMSSGDHALDASAAATANAPGVSMIGGGLHGAAVLLLRDAVSVTAGADLGVRGYNVPLRGFQDTTCHTKYGTHPCPQTATAIDGYVQPRVSLIWNSATGKRRSGFFLSAWVGADVASGISFASGLSLGLASSHAALAW